MASSAFIVTFLFPLTALLVSLAIRFVLSTLRPTNFPPGPPIIPGLGNIHQFPKSKPFLTFSSWGEQYGPIVGLKLGPTNFVVLNGLDQAREIFDIRSAFYNARPKMAVPCNYIFPDIWDRYIAFMQPEFQRFFRGSLRHHMGSVGLAEFAPIQRAIGVELLYNLSTLPDDDSSGYEKCISNWILGISTALICGRRVKELGQNWAEEYHSTQEMFFDLLEPGVAPPVDILPLLGWLPAKWKQKAKIIRQGFYKTCEAMFTHAKVACNKMASDELGSRIYEPLLSRILRERQLESGPSYFKKEVVNKRYSEWDIAILGGGVLDGASHTTQGAALFLIQALAAYPDIQRRAQAEIDSIYKESLIPPENIEKGEFPYLTACILETLRWRPITPQAFPRESTIDDCVFGYKIPKGTVFMMNVWGIQHNPEDYDNPSKFNPDRFLNNRWGMKPSRVPQEKNVTRDSDELAWRKPLYAFSMGRRGCPGEQFALNGLHVLFILLLWAYDIVADGELDLSVETGLHPGATIKPKPFKVRFIPRGERVARGVSEEYPRAEQVLTELFP